MPDYEKKIKVHYRADHTPQIWFTPNDGDVDMDATGKKSSSRNQMTAMSSPSPGSPSRPRVRIFSLDSILDDKMTVLDSDADAGTYEYCISLDTANGPVSSDPQIINKPA